MNDIFGIWWSVFRDKSKQDRIKHYNSLPRDQQNNLRQSFLNDGWCDLFCQNQVDHLIDYIKNVYNIDLFDIRIKAIKYNKSFLIEQQIWENIENMILEYEPLFNSDILFGGLKVRSWGKKKKLLLITAQQKGMIDA